MGRGSTIKPVRPVRPAAVRAGVAAQVRAKVRRGRPVAGAATFSGAVRRNAGRARARGVVVEG